MLISHKLSQIKKFYNSIEGSYDFGSSSIDTIVNYLTEGRVYAKPLEMTPQKQEWLESLKVGDELEICYGNYAVNPVVSLCYIDKIIESMEKDGITRENYVFKDGKGRIGRLFKNGNTSIEYEWAEKAGTYLSRQ